MTRRIYAILSLDDFTRFNALIPWGFRTNIFVGLVLKILDKIDQDPRIIDVLSSDDFNITVEHNGKRW